MLSRPLMKAGFSCCAACLSDDAAVLASAVPGAGGSLLFGKAEGLAVALPAGTPACCGVVPMGPAPLLLLTMTEAYWLLTDMPLVPAAFAADGPAGGSLAVPGVETACCSKGFWVWASRSIGFRRALAGRGPGGGAAAVLSPSPASEPADWRGLDSGENAEDIEFM